MRVWGIYDDEIRELLAEVGLRPWNNSIKRVGPESYRFRLALGDRGNGTRRFQKLSQFGYATPYVCWHGHREFLFALYRRFPEAKVETALDVFAGRADFLEYYKTTKGHGNGYNVSDRWDCVCQPELARANRRQRRSRFRSFTTRRERPVSFAEYARQFNPQATTRIEPVTVTGSNVTYSMQLDNTGIQWVPLEEENEDSSGG